MLIISFFFKDETSPLNLDKSYKDNAEFNKCKTWPSKSHVSINSISETAHLDQLLLKKTSEPGHGPTETTADDAVCRSDKNDFSSETVPLNSKLHTDQVK